MPKLEVQLRPVTDFMVNELIPFYYNFNQRSYCKEEFEQLIMSICDQFLHLPLSSTAYDVYPYLPLTKQGRACIAPCDKTNMALFKLVFSIEYAIYLYVISDSSPRHEQTIKNISFESWKFTQYHDAVGLGRLGEFTFFLEEILSKHQMKKLYIYLLPSNLPDVDHSVPIDHYYVYSLKLYLVNRFKNGMEIGQRKFNISTFNAMACNTLEEDLALLRNKFILALLDSIALSHMTAQKIHEEFKTNLQKFACRNSISLKGVAGYWGMDKFVRGYGRRIYWLFGSGFYLQYASLISKYWNEAKAFESRRVCNNSNIISSDATHCRVKMMLNFDKEAKGFCGDNPAGNHFNAEGFW